MVEDKGNHEGIKSRETVKKSSKKTFFTNLFTIMKVMKDDGRQCTSLA